MIVFFIFWWRWYSVIHLPVYPEIQAATLFIHLYWFVDIVISVCFSFEIFSCHTKWKLIYMLRKKSCLLSGNDVRLAREQNGWWEAIVMGWGMFYNEVILYTDIMKLKHLSQKCTKCHVALLSVLQISFRAAFFSILDEPFYQMTRFFLYEMCTNYNKVYCCFYYNHSILGCGYLIPSEASQFPWYFCLGLKSEKVTFYLLFKGLIHKAGRLNRWVRPVVSHESHSLASAYIYIHSAHNTMKVSSFMFSQVNIWV